MISNMKKIFFSLFIIAAVAGCKKDDSHIFDKSPDERLNEALAGYQATLTGAQYGWNAVVYPKGGGAYAFYFKFNDANRVEMVADFDAASATTVKESSYRLKALQQPSLLFDTYSYLHLLSDPDGYVNGGVDGQGLLSDFEFYFNDSTTADTIKLTGRVNGSKAVLVKASQEQAQAYTGGQFDISLFNESLSKILQYFKHLNIGNTVYDINLNPFSKTAIFTWSDDDGTIHTFTTAFYYTLEGIAFQTPLVSGSTIVAGFSDISWSDATNTINLTAGNTQATIKGAVKPLIIDADAPKRWWQKAADDDGYWVSLNGFHVNGVEDAFGVTSIPDYAFMIFWPKYGTSSGITYDLTGFVTADTGGLALNFGAAYRVPNFTSDGRVMFTYLGTLGDVPPEAEDAYFATAGNFLNPAGFYLVQTSETSYDMVSADDAKTWITWIY